MSSLTNKKIIMYIQIITVDKFFLPIYLGVNKFYPRLPHIQGGCMVCGRFRFPAGAAPISTMQVSLKGYCQGLVLSCNKINKYILFHHWGHRDLDMSYKNTISMS